MKLSNGYARVQEGMLKGRVLDNNVKVFHGVPYAQPPVGYLRWRYPQPAIPWGGVRMADRWGSVSLQFDMSETESLENFRSEDCLYLNVHTPAMSEEAALPVYLFIHGGGFMGGSSGHLYHGETLAQQGMVVVTINYRCNLFGFLAHPALTAEDPNHTSGNYGIADMIAAIKWVYRNARAFGGDPEKITIGGQSAGGAGVMAVISSPLTGGMVKGALVESGVFNIDREDLPDLAKAEQMGMEIAEALGAHTAEELRALPAKAIVEYAFSGKTHGMRMAPVLDGYLLPHSIREAFENGAAGDIPVIFGINAREFIAGHKPDDAMPEDVYAKRIGIDKSIADTVYPSGTDLERITSLHELISDRMLKKCMTLSLARPNARSYIYYFQKPIPNDTNDFYGAPHSCEMPYIFGRPGYGAANPWDQREWTEWDYDMMRAFQNYLRAFVCHGAPDPKYFPAWPAYSSDAPMTMVIGDEPCACRDVRKSQTDILPGIGGNLDE